MILAKHDERYMPKEVADALKKQGHWQGDDQNEDRRAPRGTVQ
jgi:cytochrome c-type biogenesis protein CcmE